MTFRSTLAKAAGQSSAFVLQRFFHRGSTLPGRIALKIDPKILGELTKNTEIIVVTGTNGKTLTTALTVGILEHAFGKIITNPTGANMITGIVSTFLKAGKSRSKRYAVLEIDEASLPKITRFITPSLFVFTNIFRDQMDRYGEIYTTYDLICEGAAHAPQATILANGDSPIFNSKKLLNPVKYYGFNHETHAPKRAHYNTEGVLCPNCQHILDYKLNTYANLGDYICENCGFTRPALDTELTKLDEITEHSSTFTIDDNTYSINVGGLYNIYNALAAVAVAEHLQLPTETIKKGFDESKAVFGRQETFQVGKKTATIVLIKNPVGANQALEMMALAPYDFSLVALLNANYADGIDTSWIWDANFERLNDLQISDITASGVRASEMARRLKVATSREINTLQALVDLPQALSSAKSNHIYILATYTAMLEAREILAQAGLIKKEMKA
ncbi:MAG: Mur ligase family protein [Streptococcaceae bacterium]|jgi:UDP-N-acetylmuramoyl-L-alanyl-D-glutamate--2,6-diaminopimelate ligase|nr:Mur ligase family protein [Streptococcaceae bacterium]